MGAYLESYSFYKSPIQGHELHKLVMSERDWLETERPSTVRRYSDNRRAIRNVSRIALNSEIMAFIVREKKYHLAIGVATVILNQTVVHPELGIVQGNNLDYWIKESCDEKVHNSVGIELEYVGGSPQPAFHSSQPGSAVGYYKGKMLRPIFSVIQIDDAYPPIGLMGNSEQIKKASLMTFGSNAELTPLEGEVDTYDVAGSGRISQIYYSAGGYTPKK
jgi:hypothetical protein